MDTVFPAWAATRSLEREMASVALAELQAGDLFIRGGSPGHAVMAADVAENKATGEARFLLLQELYARAGHPPPQEPARSRGRPLVSAPPSRAA